MTIKATNEATIKATHEAKHEATNEATHFSPIRHAKKSGPIESARVHWIAAQRLFDYFLLAGAVLAAAEAGTAGAANATGLLVARAIASN